MLFGMHSNADISFAQAEAYICLETLLNLQPREISSATVSVENIATRQAQEMLTTLPESFDLIAIQKKYCRKHK